jgi:hypothetical protein
MTKAVRDYQVNPLEVPPGTPICEHAGPGTYGTNQKQAYKFAYTFGKRSHHQPLLNPGPGEYKLKSELETQVEKAKYRPPAK